MSALPSDRRELRPMTVADLDAVMAIEQLAYAFPWTRGNFIDSLAAGYLAWVLRVERGPVCGYVVAMNGVDEMHLLNITIAPTAEHRGHARHLLDELVGACAARMLSQLWLEVRQSNQRAFELYRRYGFRQVGLRRGYYPADGGRREDAIVMSLDVGERRDALD